MVMLLSLSFTCMARKGVADKQGLHCGMIPPGPSR